MARIEPEQIVNSHPDRCGYVPDVHCTDDRIIFDGEFLDQCKHAPAYAMTSATPTDTTTYYACSEHAAWARAARPDYLGTIRSL